MAGVERGRRTATVEDELVVFFIGMRINHLWKLHRWLPVFVAMPAMLAELRRHPELGLLGRPRTFWSGRTIAVHQVWASYEQLEAFARTPANSHLGAWRKFNQRVGTNGTVGIFHETYLVGPGTTEQVYVNMAPMGLGAAVGTLPPGPRQQRAADRLGRGRHAGEDLGEGALSEGSLD